MLMRPCLIPSSVAGSTVASEPPGASPPDGVLQVTAACSDTRPLWACFLLSCHAQQGQVTERTDRGGIAHPIELDAMRLEPMGIGSFTDQAVGRPMGRDFMPP